MYCNTCGNRLPGQSPVCEKCGTDVSRPGSGPAAKPQQNANAGSALVKQQLPSMGAPPVRSTKPKRRKNKKQGRVPGIACMVVAALVFLYQLYILVVYAQDFLGAFAAYSAAGHLTDGLLNMGSYLLVLASTVLVFAAGWRSIKKRSAKRLMLIAGGMASVCMLWQFNLLVFLIFEITEVAGDLVRYWQILLYGGVVVVFAIFTWILSAFVEKDPNEQHRSRPLF